MRFYMNAFLVVVLVLAGVSPACQFISGQSGKGLFEICMPASLWQDKETAAQIPLPPIAFSLAGEDEQPQSDEQNQGHDPSMKQPPCAFCFAQDHVKQASVLSVTIEGFERFADTRLQALSDQIIQKSRREVYAPRGPPSLFV